MKFKITILLLIIVPVLNIFGKDYKNDQYGISFKLPDNWETIDVKDLPLEKQQRLENRFRPFKTLSICGHKDNNGSGRINVMVQYLKFKETTLNNAKKELSSEHGKKMMISAAELLATETIGKEIQYYRLAETKSDFVRSNNRAYGMVRYESSDKSNLVSIVIKILCGDGMVILQCFSLGAAADNFENIIHEITESFHYDNKTMIGSESSKKTSKEISQETGQAFFKLVYKWSGGIVCALIIWGIIKKWRS